MNDFFYLKTPLVKRIVKKFTGRRHTLEIDDKDIKNLDRRRSEGSYIVDDVTIELLIEYGYRKDKGSFINKKEKKLSFGSTSSTNSDAGRWSYDEYDKSCSHLGIYIRSTLNGDHVITSVDSGSPAAEAGLRKKDRIVKVNSIETRNLVNHQVIKLLSANGTNIEIEVESEL